MAFVAGKWFGRGLRVARRRVDRMEGKTNVMAFVCTAPLVVPSSTMRKLKPEAVARARAVQRVFALRMMASPDPAASGGMKPSWTPQEGASSSSGTNMQEIEYTIMQDGRVQVTVNGIKGEACLEVTKEIEEMLGNVVSRKNTEEMMEKEIVLNNNSTVHNKAQDSGSSW
ncbi:hypothetical protein FVE85_8077 [Porphyridium purpureum]|uniref:DUF2997 domain-containing protein n=1 Tax=Porphyridium purpureum TaxID=35688 RepID=A0A5J4YNQ1_PORPP|nr:hypothetical protein FVE85_8077 [Porphyridium purpureum]|eukprot:POR1257..scf295_9